MVKMWFTKFELKEVVGAGTLEKICDNCGNVGEHTLAEAPYGLGIGIPFMRPVLSTHRAYALRCPICSDAERISKDEAKALMRRGK